MTSLGITQGDAGRESPFSFGAGARGMGLGRSFISLPGEASSAFFNPAATAFIDRSDFSAFHTSLFLNTNYDCLALSHPVGVLGVFTVSAGRLGTGSFTSRDDYNRPGQDISASDMLLGLSYGREIKGGLATGVTLKGVGQEIGSNSGYGFGLDLSFQYRLPFAKGLTAGIGFNDLIQPRIKLVDIKDKYETVSRYGFSYARKVAPQFTPGGFFEIDQISGRDLSYHPGLEMAFYDNYFLRLGYDKDTPTYGAGIIYGSFRLDYAYENIDYLGGSHRVSLGISFGKSVRAVQQEAIAKAVSGERENWQKSLDERKMQDYAAYIFTADSLRAGGQYQNALFYYERALGVNETSARARQMSDSMMTLIVSTAASAAGDKKREDLISKRVESALASFKAGRLNDAISQYELALEIDPANKNVSDLLESTRAARKTEIDDDRRSARDLIQKGDFSGALLAWNKLLALASNDSEAIRGVEVTRNQIKANDLVARAVTAMNTGRYADAAIYLGQAQLIRPDDATIKSLLSESRAKAAPPTNLEDIKANPQHWEIYLRGLQNYQASDYGKALENWESLRQYYPNNPDLEKNISQARQRLSTEGGQE